MSAAGEAAKPGVAVADERVRATSPLRRFLTRPEMGSLAGVVAVFVFFAVVAGNSGFLTLRGTASYLQVSAELGILAVAVSLLMIGGEFDLSIGSIIGASGMIIAILTVVFGVELWLALAISLVFCLVVGVVNALLILRTGLPSFIVTLAMLFILRGATIGVTRHVTGRTQVGGLDQLPQFASAQTIFASAFAINGIKFAISIVWCLAIALIATWVLMRTPFGNWIFGVGGNAQAARNVGVPVSLVKIILFMATAASAWLVATIQVLGATGADVLRGQYREFYAIIAAVIGGTLLTGGYGSAIGAIFGALIYGMVQQGIVYAGVDSDWVQAVLGVMLLIAVLVNRFIRARAMQTR
jgi:simple sugar transport system permease protein